MKLINKKIIAAALALATLTGCDSLNNGEKDKVETETDQVETTDTAEDTDAADTEADKDADTDADSDADGADTDADSEGGDSEEAGGQNVTTGPDADDPTKDASPEEESEAVTSTGTTAKEQLEDSIFNNRIQARAAEILLDTAPDTINPIKDKLESLVETSNDLIQKAEAALQEL